MNLLDYRTALATEENYSENSYDTVSNVDKTFLFNFRSGPSIVVAFNLPFLDVP